MSTKKTAKTTTTKKTFSRRPVKSKRHKFYYDEAAAEHPVRFCKRFIRHIDDEWAGKPFIPEEWQANLMRELFGWKREDGTRRYRTLYLEIPRKNGKSTLGAALAIYMLFCDAGPRAQIISAAGDRDQAAIVFETAKAMIQASPKLKKRCIIRKREIIVKKTKAIYKVVSADAKTKHGLNPHGIFFDELHTQPNRELYDTLRTGRGTKKQPLEIYMTTAGYDVNSICFEVHDYALKVLDGTFTDDTILPIIYAAKKDDDWMSPKTWVKCNPNLGKTIQFSYLEEECEKAKRSPAYENTFKRLYLNIWTDAKDVWIPSHIWKKCYRPYKLEDLLGRECYVAIDLSKRIDITAMALVFPDENRQKFQSLMYYWLPEENAREREQTDRVPYLAWAQEEGYNLILTPGNVIDYDVVGDTLEQVMKLFRVKELAFDPWGSTQLANRFQKIKGLPIIEFRQGFKTMSPACKDFEAMVVSQQLQHQGNKITDWMIGNMVVKTDPAGNIKPDKSRKNTRIDGGVALIMATDRAVKGSGGGSIYKTRGLVSV